MSQVLSIIIYIIFLFYRFPTIFTITNNCTKHQIVLFRAIRHISLPAAVSPQV